MPLRMKRMKREKNLPEIAEGPCSDEFDISRRL